MTIWMPWVHGTTAAAQMPFRVGDEVRVWYRILEQEGKERLGQFQGIVLRIRGAGVSTTFTVRRVTHGEGVERVFPLDAKTTAKVELLRQGKVRRARLYYLRDIVGKTRIVAADADTERPASPASPTAPRGSSESGRERSEAAVPSA